jgi:hypothetical protein
MQSLDAMNSEEKTTFPSSKTFRGVYTIQSMSLKHSKLSTSPFIISYYTTPITNFLGMTTND